MRISDWSSDVCSSDLAAAPPPAPKPELEPAAAIPAEPAAPPPTAKPAKADNLQLLKGIGPKLAGLLNGLGVTSFQQVAAWTAADIATIDAQLGAFQGRLARDRSEEHKSELQSLMRISYAVYCLKKKKLKPNYKHI